MTDRKSYNFMKYHLALFSLTFSDTFLDLKCQSRSHFFNGLYLRPIEDNHTVTINEGQEVI